MRIKQQSNERLVIVHFPFFLALVLSSIVAVTVWMLVEALRSAIAPKWAGVLLCTAFVLLWVGLAAWIVQSYRYDFDLVRRELVWSRRSIFRKKLGRIPLDEIRTARIDINPSATAQTSYRPALVTSHGSFPLLNGLTGGSKRQYEHIVEAINQVLPVNSSRAAQSPMRTAE